MITNTKAAYRKKDSFGSIAARDWRRNWVIYMLLIPAIVYYIMFHYMPLVGNIIAFKDYNPRLGIFGSPWTAMGGFRHFIDFFNDPHFFRVVRNTITISVTGIIFGFPAPILLALLINELRNKYFVRTVQTISYLPHFISIVVVAGMIRNFVAYDGIITDFFVMFGMYRENMLNRPELFVPIFVASEIWQGIGWGSIIYLAALTGIDMELYEAATIDGAGRWKQTLKITIPCLFPTIMIMLILRLGNIMVVGFERVLLLYNPQTYVTADVISTFTFRRGMIDMNFSFAAAVDIFNSVVNCVLLLSANYMSRRLVGNSIF